MKYRSPACAGEENLSSAKGVSQITVLMQVFATSQVAFMPGL
jgi:hypothetical protein